MQEAVEAMVQKGSLVVRYLRAGRGPCTVLLTSRPEHEIADAPLFQAIASQRRVIAPIIGPEHRGMLGDVLQGVLEGLGLRSATLVVEEGLSEIGKGNWLDAVQPFESVLLIERQLPANEVDELLARLP